LLVAGDRPASVTAAVNAATNGSPVMSSLEDQHFLSEMQTKWHLGLL